MSDIRLLFAVLPAMLSEILRQAAERDPRIRVMGELGTLERLGEEVRRTRPDVVVVGGEDARLPRECERSMFREPHPRTLVISSDGRFATAYRLRPHGVEMENLSPLGIIEALRDLNSDPLDLEE